MGVRTELPPGFILSCNSCAAAIEWMRGAGIAEFGGGCTYVCVCVRVSSLQQRRREGGGGFAFLEVIKKFATGPEILLTCRLMGV